MPIKLNDIPPEVVAKLRADGILPTVEPKVTVRQSSKIPVEKRGVSLPISLLVRLWRKWCHMWGWIGLGLTLYLIICLLVIIYL